jgi:lysophospholipase L1-like esterase
MRFAPWSRFVVLERGSIMDYGIDSQAGIMRALFKDVARAVLGATVGMLVLELLLRAAFHRSLDFSIEMWKYAAELKRAVPNADLSFEHRPNSHAFLMGVDVRINSQGLRDNEYPLARHQDTYRVLMLGDSTTFGWGVALDDTSAKLLEHGLNSGATSNLRFEVINGGVGNYGTVQEVTYYETRGRALRPDLVILVYFINDAEPVPVERRGPLLDRSYLLAFTVSRFERFLQRLNRRPNWREYYSSLYEQARPGFRACQRALKDLAAEVRNDGAQLLVALLPELHEINGQYPFAAEHQKITNVLASEGVPVLDLLAALRGQGPEIDLWVTPLDAHPNGRANALVAARLRTWVLEHVGATR